MMEKIKNAGLEGELKQLINDSDFIGEFSGGVDIVHTMPTAVPTITVVSIILGNNG